MKWFKEGMPVECEIEGNKIADAKLHMESNIWFICQNIVDGRICTNTLGYEKAFCIYDWTKEILESNIVKNLRPSKTTDIEKIYVGCKIRNEFYTREVLDISGRVIHVSDKNIFDKVDDVHYTVELVKSCNYKLVPPVIEEEQKEAMINVDGKKWSVSTIKEALRNHVK